MQDVGVLMTCPMYPCLEQQLDQRFNLFRFWQFDSNSEKLDFFQQNSKSIRALVGNTKLGADAELIDLLPNLEIVSTYSVGLDKIDLLKCKERGIKVTNTPDVLTDDVADIAIGLMISVLRKVSVADAFLRNGIWKNGDFELTTKFSGKSLGIIGLGRIGSAIAKRAEAFGCEISYHSRSRKPNTTYKYYPNTVDLATDSQILVVACSLTEETRYIVNKNVINALGPDGILINIGRGQHVDEPELVSALVEGRLGGAGLDVYEDEPNVPNEMLELRNVVLFSHVGSDTFETCNDMADLVIRNLEAHFMSRPLLTPVMI